jgi:hypothetical protein
MHLNAAKCYEKVCLSFVWQHREKGKCKCPTGESLSFSFSNEMKWNSNLFAENVCQIVILEGKNFLIKFYFGDWVKSFKREIIEHFSLLKNK